LCSSVVFAATLFFFVAALFLQQFCFCGNVVFVATLFLGPHCLCSGVVFATTLFLQQC
jgi:hypothetical protein